MSIMDHGLQLQLQPNSFGQDQMICSRPISQIFMRTSPSTPPPSFQRRLCLHSPSCPLCLSVQESMRTTLSFLGRSDA
ncbi:hypothetical protein BCV70DRAFT_199664 [Testicularia cyperi]|uniref:Uncharacterized protein n=1 Tax=Testicularia cyperi TaxID=1882483 RepID=A0A317XR61_9BASI|nr:hypothetical protein BCV70DRAFT_199664 [Testicularia cyperi]